MQNSLNRFLGRPFSLSRMKKVPDLFSELESIFDSFGRGVGCSFMNELNTSDFIPCSEVEDSIDKYIIKIELPGMIKDQVDIFVDNDGRCLVVSGEKRSKHQSSEKTIYSPTDICYGKFHLEFTLSECLENDIFAELENGLLIINILKKQKQKLKRKKIDIE